MDTGEEEEGLLIVEAMNTSPASTHTKPDWNFVGGG